MVEDGDGFEEALDNVKLSIAFHIETSQDEALKRIVAPEDRAVIEAGS